MVENVVSRSLRRRHFLRLAAAATAAAVTPRALCTEQHDPSAPAAPSVATFDDVWQTVRDRFYDPHLHGLDWTAVRERYIADAARATSDDVLAGVINRMLSELHASHARYYTPDQPEYYQLADIFAGALRRHGLERSFPDGRISYPGIGILSRTDEQNRSFVIGVIEATPAQLAGLLAGDEIVSANGVPFQPVGSFRDKVGKQVVLVLRRAGALLQVQVTPSAIPSF